MKAKLFIVALLLIVVFGISSVVFAQTMTEAQRQTLISQLQAQIVTLTQQISAILAERQQQGVTSTSWCYAFENNLGFAQSGTTEIVNLHTALQKEGISYTPDDSSIYSIGTVEGVKQFQTKYKIAAPTAGYVGATTREKLNQLYGCVAIKCTSSWQNGPWTTCVNNQQTRIVTDSNNCATPTNKPITVQSCTVKPIDISVDNSDGPLDMFVTLGNGATITSTGINLTKTINLKWTGTNVSSCTASDTLNPEIFSGFQPSTGSLAVVLSGSIKAASSVNKVLDTFRISCISTLTGNLVSDSIEVDLFYNVSSVCTPSWQTGAWSACASGKKTRTVVDSNGCGSLVGKPEATENCTALACTPSWQTGAWSACASGKKTRTVTDSNNCGSVTGKPAISETCCSATCLNQTDGIYAVSCTGSLTKCASGKTCQLTYSSSLINNNGVAQTVQALNGAQCVTTVCTPSWQTGAWSACASGKKTRTVTDSNNCGTLTGKPTTSETCCSATCLDPSTGSDGVYAVSCSGSLTKCAAGRTCEPTFSTSYTYVNGIGQTVETLSGTRCVCIPDWEYGYWGSCSTSGMQSRTVTDVNNCGVSTGKPTTSQSCIY